MPEIIRPCVEFLLSWLLLLVNWVEVDLASFDPSLLFPNYRFLVGSILELRHA